MRKVRLTRREPWHIPWPCQCRGCLGRRPAVNASVHSTPSQCLNCAAHTGGTAVLSGVGLGSAAMVFTLRRSVVRVHAQQPSQGGTVRGWQSESAPRHQYVPYSELPRELPSVPSTGLKSTHTDTHERMARRMARARAYNIMCEGGAPRKSPGPGDGRHASKPRAASTSCPLARVCRPRPHRPPWALDSLGPCPSWPVHVCVWRKRA